MGNQVRVALIGAGGMGRKYAEFIVSGQVKKMVLAGVVIRRPELMDWGRSLVNQDGSRAVIYPDADAMFADARNYDAVLIATPHKTHPEFAIKAFELGKHVMCDKPAGVTAWDAYRMSEAAENAGKVYGMMFHQRLYEKYRKLKEIIESGELGELCRIMLVNTRYFRTVHYHKSGSWRSSWEGEGGGALINQGQHILDIWQWLFGMPQKMYAQIPFGKYNDFTVDDEATLTMRYAGNRTAVFILTTGEAAAEEKLEVIGTKGKAVLEDDCLTVYRYSQDSSEYRKTAQVNSREELSFTEERTEFEKKPEPYVPMLENFAEAVLSGDNGCLIAPGTEAGNALMLTNAAYYSAWKEEVVELPLKEEAYYFAAQPYCVFSSDMVK